MDRLGVVSAGASRDEARPDLAGEFIERDLPNTECPKMRKPGKPGLCRKLLASAGNPAGPHMGDGAFRPRWSAGGQMLRKSGGNHGPSAHPALHVALSHELRVSIEHRKA